MGFSTGKKARGFTLIELLVVIPLIGILVALALPQILSYRTRACNAAAKSDLKNAYTAAQAFFSDSPSGTIDLTVLGRYGYNPSPSVSISIGQPTLSGLSMSASHISGTETYTVDATGIIIP